MDFVTILFYLFSFVLIASALVVVATKNTVHSVLFLILAFVNAAFLFVLIGAEFLAMLLVIVYVGAIAVLFLFVVMMLNIDRAEIKKKLGKNAFLYFLLGVAVFAEIVLITQYGTQASKKITLFTTPENISNTAAIGNILYTDFAYPFQLCGAVLFVAMIGAIVLTLKQETRFIRKQKIYTQVNRNKTNSLEVVKVKSGEGIEI